MKKIILLLGFIIFSLGTFAQNYTKLFRNRIEADTLKANYWLIINGDTLHSLNPTEGQFLKFVGGKYVNSDPDALAADSMIFDKTTGILKIYKNGLATLQDTLDGRYATYDSLRDTLSLTYVPYIGATQNLNLDSKSARTSAVIFKTDSVPDFSSYKLFADTVNHTLAFYNDEHEIAMQIGQELWSRVYNSGAIALNGRIVRINGSFNGVATVTLASNEVHTSAEGVLGVATHDIETNTWGFITTFGEVHDLNTSSCVEGTLIYLGTNGQWTHVRPVAPNFVIEVGTCIYSHATQGKILVNVKGSPHDIIQNAFNGSFIEGMKFTVTSNGSAVTGILERTGGGDLTMQFSDGFTTLDCTPAKTLPLVEGSATVPQTNYIYVLKSTKDIALSTSGWPTDEHIKISEVACRTAALTQADGVLRNQNWNDHLSGSNGMGHLNHVNERIRRLNADWDSGVEPSVSIASVANPDNVYFSTTGGKVYQMHLQDFPAQNMPTADIHVVNHYTTPFTTTSNLNTLLTDALNVSMSNRSFSLVIWGVQNESGEVSHLMLNLPTGSYTGSSLAIADASNYSVYSIPNQFRGVGFLIARVTLSHSTASSGTWTLDQIQDLRGYLPNSAVGGSSGGGVGVSTYTGLLDTPNSYSSSANKLQGVNSLETALESKGVTATLAGTLNIPTGQRYQQNGLPIFTENITSGSSGTDGYHFIGNGLNSSPLWKTTNQAIGGGSLVTNRLSYWDGGKFVSINDGTNGQRLTTNGSGVYSFTTETNTPQTLSGTTPTWNLANGRDAKITLTGNTTITVTNAVDGMTGTLWVTNAASVYTLTFAGYVNAIDPFIRLAANMVTTSGGSKSDDFTFKYNGVKLNWNGTLNRE